MTTTARSIKSPGLRPCAAHDARAHRRGTRGIAIGGSRPASCGVRKQKHRNQSKSVIYKSPGFIKLCGCLLWRGYFQLSSHTMDLQERPGRRRVSSREPVLSLFLRAQVTDCCSLLRERCNDTHTEGGEMLVDPPLNEHLVQSLRHEFASRWCDKRRPVFFGGHCKSPWNCTHLKQTHCMPRARRLQPSRGVPQGSLSLITCQPWFEPLGEKTL